MFSRLNVARVSGSLLSTVSRARLMESSTAVEHQLTALLLAARWRDRMILNIRSAFEESADACSLSRPRPYMVLSHLCPGGKGQAGLSRLFTRDRHSGRGRGRLPDLRRRFPCTSASHDLHLRELSGAPRSFAHGTHFVRPAKR